MKIDILYKETIKPSSPTPHNLTNFKLSLIDQFAPLVYVPIVVFYHSNPDNPVKTNLLKKSLSKTLTYFYPLAGRIKNESSVDCNDEGVDFSEARVNCCLVDVLDKPDSGSLAQFLPCDLDSTKSASGSILAIQINLFNCGAVAIGVCMSHKIADGSTLSTFINSWALLTSNINVHIDPTFIAGSIFPSRDLSMMPKISIAQGKCITKRFVFDAANIKTLKERVLYKGIDKPTRIESISALIWKCAMVASRVRYGSFRPSILTHAVDLRRKLIPPLPENSVGNILWLAVASWKNEGDIDMHEVVYQLRKAISEFDTEHVKRLQGEEGFFTLCETLEKVGDFFVKKDADAYRFSSWCRFNLYSADFGWGNPVWMATANTIMKNVVIMMDMRSGDGIEAWVTLDEGDMAIFEKDHDLLEFASINPSVS